MDVWLTLGLSEVIIDVCLSLSHASWQEGKAVASTRDQLLRFIGCAA